MEGKRKKEKKGIKKIKINKKFEQILEYY